MNLDDVRAALGYISYCTWSFYRAVLLAVCNLVCS